MRGINNGKYGSIQILKLEELLTMFQRNLFEQEHEMFRASVRKFIEKEIAPFHKQWEETGVVPRELWLKAGDEVTVEIEKIGSVTNRVAAVVDTDRGASALLKRLNPEKEKAVVKKLE